MEQLFNEFFVCLYLNTLQPHLSYCWTGNFIFQSSLHGSQSRWNNVKMQMGIWIHCSVVPRHTAPGSAMSTPWGCTSTIQGIVKSPTQRSTHAGSTLQQPFNRQTAINLNLSSCLKKYTQGHYLVASFSMTAWFQTFCPAVNLDILVEDGVGRGIKTF